MKLIILIICFLEFATVYAQYKFIKVHNEIFETPEERGFFFDLECQGDTCVSFNSIGGGFAKIIVSTNSGNKWKVTFTNEKQSENNQYIHLIGGGIYRNYIYYSSMGGIIAISENSFTDFKTLFTPLNYQFARIDNCQLHNNTIYFSDLVSIYRKELKSSNWQKIKTFKNMSIVDMEVLGNSDTIYCILNNVDSEIANYKLNEKVFAKSTDIGVTWSLSKIGFDVSVISINGNQIWLVGGEGNGNGDQRDDVILLSTNSGTDWEVSRFKLSENSGAGLHGLKMKDKLEGIAFGNNGNFLRTTDAGKSWERLSINDEVDNIGFRPSIMVLEWNKYGEPILGISNMGIYVGKNETSVENQDINEITPKIFSNLLNINLTKYDKSNAIIIYSVDGSIVYESKLDIGKTTIDLSHLSSGVYFAKVNNKFVRLLKE